MARVGLWCSTNPGRVIRVNRIELRHGRLRRADDRLHLVSEPHQIRVSAWLRRPGCLRSSNCALETPCSNFVSPRTLHRDRTNSDGNTTAQKRTVAGSVIRSAVRQFRRDREPSCGCAGQSVRQTVSLHDPSWIDVSRIGFVPLVDRFCPLADVGCGSNDQRLDRSAALLVAADDDALIEQTDSVRG